MEDYIERKESDYGVYLYGRGVCRPGSRALEQKKKKAQVSVLMRLWGGPVK